MSIEQQPEAWIVINKETGYRIQVSYFPDLYNKDMFEVIPLYTAPPNHEQDSITDATLRAYMPNGSAVSNVYEAYEEGRKSVMSEQEPVAWMVETHFNNDPIKEFHTVKPMERVYKNCKVTELFAEKHHGIGGGE
jgi:hypothetical protein